MRLNAKVLSKFETKRLELGYEKCFQIHVGTENKDCFPILMVKNNDMKTATKETYLGDVLTSDGKINLNIQSRCDKGQGIINQSISMSKKYLLGFTILKLQ